MSLAEERDRRGERSRCAARQDAGGAVASCGRCRRRWCCSPGAARSDLDPCGRAAARPEPRRRRAARRGRRGALPCRPRRALGDLDRGADDGAEAGHDAHSHSDAHRNADAIAADSHPDAHADADESTDRRPAPAPRAKPRTTLGRGDSGPRVRELQERLSDLGYWLETPDGSFGALTQQAVYALQKAAGIRRDGVVGPKTTRALADRHPARDDARGRRGRDRPRRQLLLVVRGGDVRTILNTSTGNGEEYISTAGHRAVATTPRGSFTVYRGVDGPVTNSLGRAVAASVLPPRHRGARVGEHPSVAGLPRLRAPEQRGHRHDLGRGPHADREPRGRPLTQRRAREGPRRGRPSVVARRRHRPGAAMMLLG